MNNFSNNKSLKQKKARIVLFLICSTALLVSLFFTSSAMAEEGPGGLTQTPFISTITTASSLFPSHTNTTTSTATQTPTLTFTPTSTATSTPTATSSPTPTPTTTRTKLELFTSSTKNPYVLFSIIGLSVIFLAIVITNSKREIIEIPRVKQTKYNDEKESPAPIYIPISLQSESNQNDDTYEINKSLLDGFAIIKELYGILSKEKNDIFISISDLENLLSMKYPNTKLDILQTAIEIANTQGGLIKIQQAREDIYLIQITDQS